MRYLLFGIGDYYERYKKWFDKGDVLALLDNSPQKQNKLIDGIRVLPPEEGVKLPFDAIVILSFYVKTMKKQLLELGVAEEEIYHFYDLRQLLCGQEQKKQIFYYGISEATVRSEDHQKKKILMLSQDMRLGGASHAFYHAAKILAKNQYNVIVASMIDGSLRYKLLSEGIPVIIDANLQLQTMKEVEWLRGFSMIFCNTINFHVFLSERDNKIPVLWWLHDSAFFYDGINGESLRRLDRTNMKLCSVSSIPEKAIKGYVPDIETERLLFGVEDAAGCPDSPSRVQEDKLCLTVIGDIEERKGQDILIQSMKLLPEKARKGTVVRLVGRNTSMMAWQLKEETREMPEIVWTGAMDREGINEILNRTDVLVCPSREDAMSMVAVEAMAHRVPCIVSAATGIAEYIQDGINGCIFSSEDAKALAGKIEWCMDNREQLPGIGRRSRKIYDTCFSMEVFEKKILAIVNDMPL